jgi:hypothetical protein
MTDAPNESTSRPDIRPFSRRTTKVLVTLAVLFILLVSYLAARVLVDSQQDPEIRDRFERFRLEQESRNPLREQPPPASETPPPTEEGEGVEIDPPDADPVTG